VKAGVDPPVIVRSPSARGERAARRPWTVSARRGPATSGGPRDEAPQVVPSPRPPLRLRRVILGRDGPLPAPRVAGHARLGLAGVRRPPPRRRAPSPRRPQP